MKKTLFLAALIVSALTWSCASSNTTFQSTWKNPAAPALDLNGRKVVAVFMSSNDAVRFPAEDAMARELTARGANAVAAHTFLSDADIQDSEVARQKAADQGFTAAFCVRVTGSKTEYTYTPGMSVWGGPRYRHLWGGPGYWGWGWGSVREPGYLSADKVVRAETLVYSLEPDELVWSATSRTFDAGSTQTFVGQLTDDVAKRMAKDGVLSASASL